jgi:uncharacterized protein (TIGR02996 family)
MRDEQSLLRAILDSPEDDLPRLAYADWLMEQGDEERAARGELIQVQVQLANRAEGLGDPADWVDAASVPRLKAREQALLAQHGKEWAGPVAGLVDAYQFRKGFVESVTLQAGRWLWGGDTLFTLTPLRRVRLTDGINKRVADSPLLARLEGLDFSRTQMSDAGLNVLLASPHLGRLAWLDLSYCYLTNRGAQALADWPGLARLTHLNLGYNVLGLPAVQALFASTHWGGVRSLVLTGNQIDSRALQFLAGTLHGTADPALLRSMLQMASRQERQYTGAAVRELAHAAARSPDRAAVLAAGLRDGRRKVRSAAAQLLARLGASGASGLPGLVQRLFEAAPLVRDQVAPALARLLPALPQEMQRWLCVLANPLLGPSANLTSALAESRLPPEVVEELAGVAARRAAWWDHVGHKRTGAAPAPAPGSYNTDLESVRVSIGVALARAELHAGRHHKGNRKRDEQARGREKEAAWFLARLTELLQAHLDPRRARA